MLRNGERVWVDLPQGCSYATTIQEVGNDWYGVTNGTNPFLRVSAGRVSRLALAPIKTEEHLP